MGPDRITRRVHLATGVTVPYLEQGDPRAPAVLLLHAWVESSACFDRLLQAVPPTLRVFAMDQRGHGDADKPADGYALVNFAEDIEAFMTRSAYSRLSCSGPPAVATSRNRSLYKYLIELTAWSLSAHRAAFRAGQPLPTR
jgi:hypothetical protein